MRYRSESRWRRTFSAVVAAIGAAGLLMSCGSDDVQSADVSAPSDSARSDSDSPQSQEVGSGTGSDAEARVASACELLTPAMAGTALGGEAELKTSWSGSPSSGVDVCAYGLVGGSGSTYVELTIFDQDSESYGGPSVFVGNCVGDEVLTRVDDVAPGALRCLATSSYSGYTSAEDVMWEADGRGYGIALNDGLDDHLPFEGGLILAREIADAGTQAVGVPSEPSQPTSSELVLGSAFAGNWTGQLVEVIGGGSSEYRAELTLEPGGMNSSVGMSQYFLSDDYCRGELTLESVGGASAATLSEQITVGRCIAAGDIEITLSGEILQFSHTSVTGDETSVSSSGVLTRS